MKTSDPRKWYSCLNHLSMKSFIDLIFQLRWKLLLFRHGLLSFIRSLVFPRLHLRHREYRQFNEFNDQGSFRKREGSFLRICLKWYFRSNSKMVRNWLRLSTDVVRAIIVAISIAVTTIGISSGLGKSLLDHSENSGNPKITTSPSNHYLSGKMKITSLLDNRDLYILKIT